MYASGSVAAQCSADSLGQLEERPAARERRHGLVVEELDFENGVGDLDLVPVLDLQLLRLAALVFGAEVLQRDPGPV